MAATYDLTAAPQTGYTITHGGSPEIRKQSFNVATQATQAAGDLTKLIKINAGEFVRCVWVRIITASTTGSSTIEVGDTASATAWVASQSATAAAGTITAATGANIFTQSGTTPFAVTWLGGKAYTAADYVGVTLGATPPANGVFEVIAEVLPITAYGNVI